MKGTILVCTTIILLQISCKTDFSNEYIYPNDIKISDTFGQINNSNVLILPTKINRKNHEILYTGMDSIFSSKQNKLWKALDEKILYNYYLKYDQIRFIWFQALRKEQYVFRIIHKEDKYLVLLKIIRDSKTQREKDSIEFLKSIEYNEVAKSKYKEYLEERKSFAIDSVINFDNHSEIAFCKAIEISQNSWEKLISTLDSGGFWNASPNNKREVLDGETWITEAHFKKAYWFRYQTSPNDADRKVGELAIKIIGLNDR